MLETLLTFHIKARNCYEIELKRVITGRKR